MSLSKEETMKKSMHFVAVVILAASVLVLANPTVMAGRIGGPLSTVSTAPGGTSVFYDVSFAEGPAIVTIRGDGNSLLILYVYDADGHVTIGAGSWDRKTANLNVYRAGVFRVEVRNLGASNDTFMLTTN
jgi:hypothetical protein